MSPILGIWASAQQGANVVGDYESIQTVTVGAGSSNTITFSSIPSTYTHLQIRSINRIGANAVIQFNSDTTYTNYRSHYIEGDGASIGSGSIQSGSYDGGYAIVGKGIVSNTFGPAVIDILDYTNTSKYKTVRGLSAIDQNGSGYVDYISSLWMSTSAISSITFRGIGANFQEYSSFALYGIK
jgi:hypothetical protein